MTISALYEKYPPVLHVKEMADILSISHNTAYNLVRSGQVRSVRVGRTYRIPIEAIVDYLNKSKFVAI